MLSVCLVLYWKFDTKFTVDYDLTTKNCLDWYEFIFLKYTIRRLNFDLSVWKNLVGCVITGIRRD